MIDDSQEKTETLDDGFLGGRVEHKEEKRNKRKKKFLCNKEKK